MDTPGENAHPESGKPARTPRFWSLMGYFLKLGALGFGGPVALVGHMHRDLVERRRWVSEDDYKLSLTLAQIMPGPLAAQTAIAIGYSGARGPRSAQVAEEAPAAARLCAFADPCCPVSRNQPDHRLHGQGAAAAILVLPEGRNLRFRERPGHCPFPSPGTGSAARVAYREAVSRRRRGCHDHAGSRGHHRRLHRVPGRPAARRGRFGARHLPACLPAQRHSRFLVQKAIVDIPTAAIALASLVLLLLVRIPEPVLVAAAGAVGIGIWLWSGKAG